MIINERPLMEMFSFLKSACGNNHKKAWFHQCKGDLFFHDVGDTFLSLPASFHSDYTQLHATQPGHAKTGLYRK